MKHLIEEIKGINSWKKARPILLKLFETIESNMGSTPIVEEVPKEKDLKPTITEMTPVELESALEQVMVETEHPLHQFALQFIEKLRKDVLNNEVEGIPRVKHISPAGVEHLNNLLHNWELTDKSVIFHAPKETRYPKRWPERLHRLKFKIMLTQDRLEILFQSKGEEEFIPFLNKS